MFPLQAWSNIMRGRFKASLRQAFIKGCLRGNIFSLILHIQSVCLPPGPELEDSFIERERPVS